MSRDWRAVTVLCVAIMLGAAACTSSPPHQTAGAAQSAAVEPSTAESAAANQSPAASGATLSRRAQSSPTQVATTVAATTTKKPTSGAPHTTTAAAAGVRVTSVSLRLEYAKWAGLCDPTITVHLQLSMTFSASDTLIRSTIQLHSSDGHDPAPRSFVVLPEYKDSFSPSLTYDVSVDPASPKRTIDFWVETLEPNHMTSARTTYTIDCHRS
ncbi:hypothetical protein [Dactylosporangium sp. CA-092794]|uniref:hypothetical protein n=1 Tax=Dactylosporangium sp. CA-092794 TaxID=3239929 RepID=UPI003D8D1B31